jgi:hypothetical protein
MYELRRSLLFPLSPTFADHAVSSKSISKEQQRQQLHHDYYDGKLEAKNDEVKNDEVNKVTTADNEETEEASDAFDVEDASGGIGMRRRGGRNPNALSVTSQKYDIDGDGKLNDAELAMREMDTVNLGYMKNEQVYKVMIDQMKLQHKVFSLKRMSVVLLLVVFLLFLATLGTSFAAATLAKEIACRRAAAALSERATLPKLFTEGDGTALAEEDGTGRRLEQTFQVNTIKRSTAGEIYRICSTGDSVFLQLKCVDDLNKGYGPTLTLTVGICPQEYFVANTDGNLFAGGVGSYTYILYNGQAVQIFCFDTPEEECDVTFPAGQSCSNLYHNHSLDPGQAQPVDPNLTQPIDPGQPQPIDPEQPEPQPNDPGLPESLPGF